MNCYHQRPSSTASHHMGVRSVLTDGGLVRLIQNVDVSLTQLPLRRRTQTEATQDIWTSKSIISLTKLISSQSIVYMMTECSRRVQTTRLLVVYLTLLALGVLFETELLFDPLLALYAYPPEANTGFSQSLRKKISVGNAIQYEYRMKAESSTSALLSITELGAAKMGVSPGVNYVELLTISEVPKGSNTRYNGVEHKQDDIDVLNKEISPARYHKKLHSWGVTSKAKLLKEINAFDELNDLLTTSTTRCLMVDSLSPPRNPQKLSKYRCSVHNFSECHHKSSTNKRYSKLCSRYVRHSYDVKPVTSGPGSLNPFQTDSIKTDPSKTQVIKTQDLWRQEEEASGDVKTSHHKITVDAHYTFLEDLRSLGSSQRLTLDTKFDLAGLNAIHKYEIVGRLLQAVRWALTQRGYHLMRSSADEASLLQYLHQEGFQEPVHVLTLWHLHR
ncbi:uncharacterized protein [Panulirus ornatus]|uniref:uncharacterized protein isoform X2 n=1 Tax=Panulirus ornatus TaxID=150431 RepID=UPI003A8870DC